MISAHSSLTGTDLESSLSQYLVTLKARGYSQASIKSRSWGIGEFVSFAGRSGITDARSVTDDFLRKYLMHQKEKINSTGKPYSPRVIDSFAVSVRVFFRHLSRRGLLLFDPASELPETKFETIPSAVLSPAQAERILALADTNSREGIRDRALLELLYSTGIRRAELASLQVCDVRPDSGTIFVRQGKGKKDRILPAGQRAMMWVQKYITESRVFFARDAAESSREILFLSSRGRAMSPNLVTKIAARYVRSAGTPRGACHIFRHTCATEMLSNGADIIHIQELLGHANPETSRIYTHVSPRMLREKYVRTHPAAFTEIPLTARSADCAAAMSHAGTYRAVVQKQRGRLRKKQEFIPRSDLDAAMLEYFEYRRLELAARSLEASIQYLRNFSRWCFSRGLRSLRDLSLVTLESYQRDLSGRKKKTGAVISLKTQRYEMEAVCAFVRWCFRRGKIICDPSGSIELPKIGFSLVADILSGAEIERVLSLPDTRYPYGLRDRAILEILYASGIRSSELSALSISDADFERDSIRVHAAKLGRDRVIPVSNRAMRILYRYVHEARDQFVSEEDTGVLFLSDRGIPLERSTLRVICAKYLTLAGIKKEQAVHIFRHSCAGHMIENGADLRTVQEFLGHRCLRSTTVYAHLSIKKLKEVHASTHPAEKRFLDRMRMSDAEIALADDSDANRTEAVP